LIGDHSGAFGEYQKPFSHFSDHYAKPVNQRAKLVADPVQFADVYLRALKEQFLHVQEDYRKRRRAFDTLFKHLRYDKGGSFAYRWECVLKRLDQANVEEVVAGVGAKISVLARRTSTEMLDTKQGEATAPEKAKLVEAI
jgi:hypothetical protein